MSVSRKPIFDAVRRMLGRGFTPAEIEILDAAIDTAEGPRLPNVAPAAPVGRVPSARIVKFLHGFEQCKLEAYPDPGSRDGSPWTIGWGSTGPDIRKGTVWTQHQADARFAQYLAKLSADMDRLLGDAPTTQDQYDAMLSLAYNIGTGAFASSTLLKKHKAGLYAEVPAQFLRWNKNDGKVMPGLTRRRNAEADIYEGKA